MIFLREVSDPLTGLVKKVEKAAADMRSRGVDTYVVFHNNEDKDLETKLKAFVEKEQIQSCALSISKAIPAGYKVPKDADVTVLCFLQQTARAVFTYKKGELTPKDADRIVDTIDGLTEQPF